MDQNLQDQARGFSTILRLEQQLRHAADLYEFEFLVVNETHSLIPFRQAVLWRWSGRKSGTIKAISGLTSPDRQSPFVFWFSRVLKTLPPEKMQTVTSAELPENLADEWQEWLPEQGLWVPLKTPKGKCLGALFLSREEKWQAHDLTLLELLADIYGYSWAVFLGDRWWKFSSPWFTRFVFWFAILFFLSTPFIPARISVLAPAEVIPLDPTLVRAPLDGVVKDFFVSPNETVKAGDTLFSLDDTTLRNRLLAAKKSLGVAEAELKKVKRKAISDPNAKADLVLLKKRAEERVAAVAYVQELMERIVVKADQDGIAIFSDAGDLIGKPVVIGEKILILAQPEKAELEIKLPVADAINLEQGAEVLLFLNMSPESPIRAILFHAGYRAQATEDGFLAYRLKAGFSEGAAPPRIGLMGTAKIYGNRSNLFYLVMRRPMAAIRQKLGL